MFSNLIESGSHAADLRRKGRFFIGTTLFYALLLCATGVGSIYAYNVRLEERTDYEVLALMHFPPAAAEERPRQETRPASSPARASQVVTRTEISMQTPYHSDRIASATAREVGPKVAVALGRFDSGPEVTGEIVGPYVPGHGNSAGNKAGPTVEDPAGGPPPTPPTPTPKPTPAPTPRPDEGPVRLASSVITSKVIDKPAPPYPQVARAAGVQGVVAVQILVDEGGRVVSAKAASGNPLLHLAAVQAAYKACFTPTLLSGKPVKVTGSITYNFLLR